MSTIVAQICIRRDTAANFTSANPTLALGEIAYETDTRNIKVGDGATAWTALPYINPYRGTAAAPTSNTVLGSEAGAALQAGATENVFVGRNSGQGTTTGDGNVSVGAFSTTLNTTSSSNTAVGTGAFYGGTGSQNVALGREALNGQTGNNATAVGFHAARINTASDITAVGANALDANTTGTGNTAVGKDALGANTTGAGNTAIGFNAGLQVSTAQYFTAVGTQAGGAVTTQASNDFFGYQAGQNIAGGGNLAMGAFAHGNATSGSNNCVIGNASMYAASGSSNCALGAQAGRYDTAGVQITSASDSIFIGQDTRSSANSQTNQIVIGKSAIGNGSNTTTIGNSSTTGTFIPAGDLAVSSGAITTTGTSGSASAKGIFARSFQATSIVGLVPNAGNDGQAFVGTTTNNLLQIRTNTTTRMTVGTDGNVSIANGNLVMSTAGTGIDFSATAHAGGMTSELLSDYEEGTWTPTYIPSSGSFATMTMDILSATYTKVGRQVTVRAAIRTDNVDTTGGSGDVRISGLPFTSASGNSGLSAGSISAAENFAASGFPSAIGPLANSTTLALNKRATSNGATAACTPSDLTTGATADRNALFFCVTYFT